MPSVVPLELAVTPEEVGDVGLPVVEPLVLAVVGLVVLAEDALFVGFVIPGETVAILGGVAASLGHVPLTAVLAVVVGAAVVGDTIGFEVGRRLGPRILGARILQRHRSRLDEARGFLGRRGGWAVFLGRWTAFFRAVMPALAGTTPMSYRRFFVFNATGGLLWGVAVVLAGYLAGASYARVEGTIMYPLDPVTTGKTVSDLLRSLPVQG